MIVVNISPTGQIIVNTLSVREGLPLAIAPGPGEVELEFIFVS